MEAKTARGQQHFRREGSTFVCTHDDGRGDGICRTGYKTDIKRRLDGHHYQRHNVKSRVKVAVSAKKRHSRRLAKSSLTSNVSWKKLDGAPLLDIEPYSSDDDEDSPSFKEFTPIYKASSSKESFSPYHATLYVAYFPPGKVDHGVKRTYSMEKYTKNFAFYLYFGTSASNRKHCAYLDGESRISDNCRLVQLMEAGAVCYTQDYVMKGGTEARNKRRAVYWQHYWKTVNQIRQRVKKDGNTVSIEILNEGNRRKANVVLRPDHFQSARRFATQNRSFFPLPRHHLPTKQFPPFIKYELKKTAKVDKKVEILKKYSSKNKGIDQQAKLHEKMTSEALDHDEQEHPILSRALVNFTQKAIDKVVVDVVPSGQQEEQPLMEIKRQKCDQYHNVLYELRTQGVQFHGPSKDESDRAKKLQELEASSFEKRILELAKEFPKGIPDKILQNEMPSSVSAGDRAAVINKLLEQGILDLYKQGNELLYRLKSEKSSEPEQMKDADKEEKVVYDIIKEANNMGIWIWDIRVRSNLMMSQLNIIVKSLENRKLIKAVNAVASKKKVYMLYNVDPRRSLTGRAGYSDQDFESEFVTVLNQQCYKYLSDKRTRAQSNATEDLGPKAKMAIALTTLDELWKYICKLGISKVDLTPEDITRILNTLIYDGKVEKIQKADLEYYLAAEPMLDTTGLTQVPCGVCPVVKDCSEGGIINPGSCVYMNSWLEF